MSDSNANEQEAKLKINNQNSDADDADSSGGGTGADTGALPEHSGSEEPLSSSQPASVKPVEIGGPPGPEPTRYGDWQFKGRVSDF